MIGLNDIDRSASWYYAILLAACSEVAYRHLVEPNKLLKIEVADIKILDEIEKKRAIGFY